MRNRASERNCSMKDSSAIQMHGNSPLMSTIDDLLHSFWTLDNTACHVVRIFENDETSLRTVVNRWVQCCFDGFPG